MGERPNRTTGGDVRDPGLPTRHRRPRLTPARLAYTFYASAATGAVIGQVWVALLHIPWTPSVPVWARVAVVLPFAACLELLGMATAAMADERQRAGERAYGFRVLSAAAAALAVGVIVVGHWPRAYEVAGFGALSAAAYLLWLLHSAARRREALRARGLLGTVAPAYGLYRRLRHPILTARAAELARERGLDLYASIRAAHLELRAEARRPAIAAAVEEAIRADHADPGMAEIAVRTLDLDRIAAELEARADYTGWADRLAPAVMAHRPADRSPTRHAAADGETAQRGTRTRGKRGGRSAAGKVAAARKRHPAVTQSELAKLAKVGLRTAARHDPGRQLDQPDGHKPGVPELADA